MKYKEFIKRLNEINKPLSKLQLNVLFNLPDSTIFRYLRKGIDKKDILFIIDKKQHPKKFPLKIYFINNLKTSKKMSDDNLTVKAASMMPKGLLFNLIKSKFTQKAGFKCQRSIIHIDFDKDYFSLEIINDDLKRNAKREDKQTEYSDMSEILLEKVKKKIAAEFKKTCTKINIIILKIDFINKSSSCDAYFIMDGEKSHLHIKELF